MNIKERQYLRILQILERTDTITPLSVIRHDYNNAIAPHVLNRITEEMQYDGLIESDKNDPPNFKINAAGKELRELLQLEKEYEEKVKQVPQSVITTNKATEDNIPRQNRILMATAFFILCGAVVPIILSRIDNSKSGCSKQSASSIDTQIIQIQKRLLKQENLIDSLKVQVQSVKAKIDAVSKNPLDTAYLH